MYLKSFIFQFQYTPNRNDPKIQIEDNHLEFFYILFKN